MDTLKPETLTRVVAQSPKTTDQEYSYMMYVWDGSESSSLTRSTAYLKAIELNILLQKAKDAVMKVLFSGGVVRGNKL
jgi:hypothetical protein